MSHEKLLTNGIQDLRKNELLFDYTLVAEGESIPVHKVVMAACSDYFRVMLTGDMLESKDNRVELKEVTARSLRALVDYAYTGELDLSMKNIGEIVSSATYFQMKQAVEQCVDFLNFEIFEENLGDSVDIFNIVNMYSLPISNIASYISEQFGKIPDDRIVSLSGDNLAKILSRRDLSVASEIQLFKKVVAWIRATPNIGEDMIFCLLSKIRFPLMPKSDLADAAQTEVMKTSSKCQDLLLEAQVYHKDVFKQPLLQSERTQVRSNTESFILATEKSIYEIDKKNLDVSKLMPVGATGKEKFFINQVAVTVDNFLYVCGTSGTSHKFQAHRFSVSEYFYRYDPRFGVWLELPSMTGKRYCFELIPCEDFLFAFGGASEKLVEGFSIRENKWETRASMITPRFGMAGAEFNGKIYLCGGYEFTSYPTKYLDCYNPSCDTWESKAPMPHHGRTLHMMRRIKDKLYVLGGRLAYSVDYYSPDLDQWTSCRRLQIDVVGAFVSDETYLLGMHTEGEDEDQLYMLYNFDPDISTTVSCADEMDLYDDELDLPRSLDIINCLLLTTPSLFHSENIEESDHDSLGKTGESSE